MYLDTIALRKLYVGVWSENSYGKKKEVIGENSMVRYRESDFVLRTVDFFPDYFFLCGFFRPNFLRSRGRARRSQPKSISGKAGAQFQMFTTLPKSYNENQFLAHIVGSLQKCHSDPLEIYIQNLLKKKLDGAEWGIAFTIPYRRFFPP